MILVTYPIQAFEEQEQFINHPDDIFKEYDTTKKEEAKQVFMMLLAQFGNQLQIFNMSTRSYKSWYENIENFINDINHQEIDFENIWCVLLDLNEDDVRSIMDGYKRDFVLIDGLDNTPFKFNERNDSMEVYGDFESAMADKNEIDKLCCLLSVKNPDNKNEYNVHVFQMKFEDVQEIAQYNASENDKEWFKTSYDELCKLFVPKKKMYLLQCQYANGNHFEGNTYNQLFESQDTAMIELSKEREKVEREFNRVFGDDNWKEEDRGDYIMIDFNCYEDYWEGQVIELEVN